MVFVDCESSAGMLAIYLFESPHDFNFSSALESFNGPVIDFPRYGGEVWSSVDEAEINVRARDVLVCAPLFRCVWAFFVPIFL